MKLKQRAGDFRVRELLVDGYLQERGDYRVYRVTKRKLTSPEAARVLALEAGVDQAEVGLAGWKDRQGVTIQHMSVPRGQAVRLQSQELKIETVGFAAEPLDGSASRGNAFELTVRGLERADLDRLRESVPVVREHGTVNYFDDQRFGNLTHGQGWIVKDLMRGDAENALLALLTAKSPRDDERHRRFKRDVSVAWGDWRACRDAAGKFGAHHSIFEHLARDPEDFAGAFEHVATRLKLIHLYAWQSHLWNRAVCDLVRTVVPAGERVPIECEEGTLVAYSERPPEVLARRSSFPIPGAGLDEVTDKTERDLLEEALAQEGLVADQMRIEGIGGFHFKGERRDLLIVPRHLRVRPPEPDDERGLFSVRVRFELPRGAYATLVVKRLFGRSLERRAQDAEGGGQRRYERPRAQRYGRRYKDQAQRNEWRQEPERGRSHGRRRDEEGEGRYRSDSSGRSHEERSRSSRPWKEGDHRGGRERGSWRGRREGDESRGERQYGRDRDERWSRGGRERGDDRGRPQRGYRDDRGSDARGDREDRRGGQGRSYGPARRHDGGRGRGFGRDRDRDQDRDRDRDAGARGERRSWRERDGRDDDRGRVRDGDRRSGGGGGRSHSGGERQHGGGGRQYGGGGRQYGGGGRHQGGGGRHSGGGGGRQYGGSRGNWRDRNDQDRDRRSYGRPDDRRRGSEDRGRGSRTPRRDERPEGGEE